MRIWVWLASWACRLRHPCPITESCRHAGQMRTISPGLPSASFHAINTITAVAKASSGSPLERCPVGRLRYLLNHKSIWKKSLTLPRHPSAFRYWPVNESHDFPNSFLNSLNHLHPPNFRLPPPSLLSLVDEYPQANRRQPPQRATLHRPTLRRGQGRLPFQFPENRPLRPIPDHLRRRPRRTPCPRRPILPALG